ncbi:unnamed protein product [Hermetia illucens]|uniref:Uncharacterized protein n=1 Tax=Hermetia illucens TaxID=343691 RepID=A0A7R8UU86_HERIL|nr:unnamed protein product [Hermetia illucens]
MKEKKLHIILENPKSNIYYRYNYCNKYTYTNIAITINSEIDRIDENRHRKRAYSYVKRSFKPKHLGEMRNKKKHRHSMIIVSTILCRVKIITCS